MFDVLVVRFFLFGELVVVFGLFLTIDHETISLLTYLTSSFIVLVVSGRTRWFPSSGMGFASNRFYKLQCFECRHYMGITMGNIAPMHRMVCQYGSMDGRVSIKLLTRQFATDRCLRPMCLPPSGRIFPASPTQHGFAKPPATGKICTIIHQTLI